MTILTMHISKMIRTQQFKYFKPVVVSIIQTYHPWTAKRTSGQIVNKKIDAKARLTEILVNDLIGHWQ